MLAVEDVIAERAFDVDGEREPALVFRLSRPYQTEGDYPYCRCEFITGTTSSIVVPPEISSAVAKEKKSSWYRWRRLYSHEPSLRRFDGGRVERVSFRRKIALGGLSRGGPRFGLTDHRGWLKPECTLW